MGGLVGQCFTKRPVGDAAGSKGLPEGFARILGHDVLAVIAGDQHHDMAGSFPAFVTTMDFTRWVLVVRVAHTWAREERQAPIIFLFTWLSISPYQCSEQPHILRCCRLALPVQADSCFCGLLVSDDDMAGGASLGCCILVSSRLAACRPISRAGELTKVRAGVRST